MSLLAGLDSRLLWVLYSSLALSSFSFEIGGKDQQISRIFEFELSEVSDQRPILCVQSLPGWQLLP